MSNGREEKNKSIVLEAFETPFNKRDYRNAEHWDVIQDEATRAQSKSGNPMFGSEFPVAAKNG